MKKVIISLAFLTFGIPFVQMFAEPTYVPTSCGIVYTDTDLWTDAERQILGDLLEALCDQDIAAPED